MANSSRSRSVSSVYVISGPDGHYVGFTVRSVQERFFDHVKASRGTTERHPLYRSMREHGVDAFAVTTVAQSPNEGWARDVEQLVMSQMRADGERVLNGFMGRQSRLTAKQREDLWVRRLLGESPEVLSREFGLAVKTIQSEYGFGIVGGYFRGVVTEERARKIVRRQLIRPRGVAIASEIVGRTVESLELA